jgi:O-methyltransferase involved in polyketide biosynthesis
MHLVPQTASRSWVATLPMAPMSSSTATSAGCAVVVSTGVTMYLTKDANAATLRHIAGLAPASTLAMTFLLPAELLDDDDRGGFQVAERGARAAGTPFISFYTPDEMLALAREAGFTDARHVWGTLLTERYFADRTDGLRPSSGEDLLVATT